MASGRPGRAGGPGKKNGQEAREIQHERPAWIVDHNIDSEDYDDPVGNGREVVVQLDGEEAMLPRFSPNCTYCRWWRPMKGRACRAYPEEDSIPWPIWRGEVTHVFPYRGDHGIQFEAANDAKELPDEIVADLRKKQDLQERGQPSDT